MLFYLLPVLFSFFLSFYKLKGLDQYSSRFIHLFIVSVAIIFCGGYMTGSDWRNYEILYDEASVRGLNAYDHEKGFYLFMLFFKWLGISFFPFLIICKLSVFLIISTFLRNQYKVFYLPFALFISSDALFIFVDNPLRFMLALGVVVCSYRYIFKRNFLYYSLIICLAACFHISSLIMLPLYFLNKIDIGNKLLIFLYIVSYFVSTPDIVLYVIDKIFPFVTDWIRVYYEQIGLGDFTYFSIGKIVRIFIFLLILKNKKNIINYNSNGRHIFMYSVLFFFISIIGNTIPTFFRFSLFFASFMYISLGIILSGLSWKNIIKPFLLSYFIFAAISNIYATYVYIPYSNYFWQGLFQDLSYDYRYNYNLQKYNERTGKWPTYLGEDL